MSVTLPKVYDFGAGKLAELAYLEELLGISRNAARRWLVALHIDPIYIGNEVYFSLPTFQRIMFVLTRPGGPGFAFPGSPYRRKDKRLKEVTQVIIDKANDPMTLVEMAAANSNDPNLLRKILDHISKTKTAKKEPGNE